MITAGKHKVHIELKSLQPLHSVVIENTVVLESQQTVVMASREGDTNRQEKNNFVIVHVNSNACLPHKDYCFVLVMHKYA